MTARLRALLDTMVASISDARGIEAREKDRRAWHSSLVTSPGDVDALCAVDDQAFFVYRRLIRGTFRSAIANELPRARALVGERFDVDAEAFVSEALSRSHYLRDVAFEFLELVGARWKEDPSVPPWAVDLARFELATFESASAPPPLRADRRTAPKLELDAPVLFDESVRIVRFDWPVHELDESETTGEISKRPTALLVYRDVDLELHTLELSSLAATIVEGLLRGEQVKDAILGGCRAEGASVDGTLLEDVARILADYAERGILLGVPVEHQTVGTAPKAE
jgi:hypothetical protein